MAPTYYTSTAGSLFNYSTVVFNAYHGDDGIELRVFQIIYYLTLALAIIFFVSSAIVSLVEDPIQYAAATFLWVVTVGVFHHQMWPCDRQFGWLYICSWWLVFQVFTSSFRPFMPAFSYVTWIAIIVGLSFAFRPDQSLDGFALWAAAIYVIRYGINFIYILYLLSKGAFKGLFSFDPFASTWRRCRPRWFPLSSRQQDAHSTAALCAQCNIFIGNSKLIMGSSYFSRLVEWHEFSTRDEFSSKFKIPNSGSEVHDIMSSFPEPPCHLCCLIWYSMSPIRQREVRQKSIEVHGNSHDSTSSENLHLPRPRDLTSELRIKVWEERPLSPYTYLQLHWGGTAIGCRVLVFRESREARVKPFAIPSPAISSFKTNSAAHFEQAKKWLNMCRGGHKLCQVVEDVRLDLPARMLYVSGGRGWTIDKSPEIVKLVQTSQIDPKTEYLALSHCWGKTEEMGFKLIASNLDACFERIDFGSLSNNIKDAIIVTISLGFSYIWIDSLCILQRDYSNKEDNRPDATWRKDWETEAKNMRGVYSKATCTIASTGSSSSTGGCFHGRSRTSLKPCKIGVSSPDALLPLWIYARKDDVIEFQRGVAKAPLSTRGWAIQERLLSRRILHFGADMMLWECCSRSASELNPQGYTYKKFSEDFSDYYRSNHSSRSYFDGYLYRRARKELRRRALVQSRPPPAIVDPDAPHDNQGVWQHKFAFRNDVLKPTDQAWDDDEESEATDSARAGLRAAFERLRGGLRTAQSLGLTVQVGQDSFSQLWYNVVESYSRGKLTWPTDKLIALKSVEDDVARATEFTYLRGLWREQLLTDLLWFAIDGPGRRLLNNQIPVAPTWSWASIEGAVSLDLLPESPLRGITESKVLTTIEYASRSSDNPCDMTIVLNGPLLPISAPDSNGTMWTIHIDKARQASARFFPDIQPLDISSMTRLACLAFLVLHREKELSEVRSSNEDVQGLVLRFVSSSREDDNALDTYERVGYFTTSYMPKSRAASRGRKALKEARVKTLRIAGWSRTELTRRL